LKYLNRYILSLFVAVVGFYIILHLFTALVLIYLTQGVSSLKGLGSFFSHEYALTLTVSIICTTIFISFIEMFSRPVLNIVRVANPYIDIIVFILAMLVVLIVFYMPQIHIMFPGQSITDWNHITVCVLVILSSGLAGLFRCKLRVQWLKGDDDIGKGEATSV